MLKPDVIVTLTILLGAILYVGWLVQPVWAEDGFRASLREGITLLPPVVMALWWIPRFSLRLRGYRQYYRFRGPRCTVTVMGWFRVGADLSDHALLDRVRDTSRESDLGARETARLTNSSSIALSAGSLTTNVQTRELHEDCDGEDEGWTGEVEGEEVEKSISVTLTMIGGRLTGTDDTLRRYALPLLRDLYSNIRMHDTAANLSIQVRMDGPNPFQALYVRDVPKGHVDELRLTLRQGLDLLEVTETSIAVTARTPESLVDAARRYLASPNLAHRD